MGTGENDHYFTASPASAEQRRTVRVGLVGREVDVHTASGVFCPDRLDLGTAVLLRTVPDPPEHGELLDLGCGWGPIALTMALLSPRARVWAVDVNDRALDLMTGNAERVGCPGITAARPEDVPDGLHFDAIWSNPPIRVGKEVLHDLLQRWLPRLSPTGSAYLVVGKNLGADSLQRWIVETFDGMACRRVASAKGFRVLAVSRAGT
jgi:16S rRNA (guanine1207-N2)-methyltransferase